MGNVGGNREGREGREEKGEVEAKNKERREQDFE